MCRDEGHQCHKQPKKSLQQFLFSEGGGGNRASSLSENDESQSREVLDLRSVIGERPVLLFIIIITKKMKYS